MWKPDLEAHGREIHEIGGNQGVYDEDWLEDQKRGRGIDYFILFWKQQRVWNYLLLVWNF